jgi:phosphoribosylformimino-5-aminoimidazole carboxamide ribotide isomerase
MFTIYPAIDLRNGQVVRLKQGDPNRQTIYSDNPLAIAKTWESEGATWLHVVNLDGAFGENTTAKANRKALIDIACGVKINIQFGGGIRDIDDVQAAFDSGANRVVLGTAAIENPRLVSDVIKQYGASRLVVGLDSREGKIVTRGWQTVTNITAIELGNRMKEMGVIHALYTEIVRDGTMSGSAAELTAALAQITELKVIASGGVRDLDDIKELALYAPGGVSGVIVGRALYEGAIDLREAMNALRAIETSHQPQNPRS